MVALGEHGSCAGASSIDGARYPDGKGVHAARERLAVVGFGEQMNVIALHTPVHDAEALARRGTECGKEGMKGAGLTQRANLA